MAVDVKDLGVRRPVFEGDPTAVVTVGPERVTIAWLIGRALILVSTCLVAGALVGLALEIWRRGEAVLQTFVGAL